MLSTSELGSIDHIMMLSPSAEIAKKYINTRFGIVPEYGGEHPGIGTCNYLLSLGGTQYLEILAPAGPKTTAGSDSEHALVEACRVLESPRPHTFCVAVRDFEKLAQTLQANNIEVSAPIKMQRQRPDGALLKWELLTCFDCSFGAVFPFFIKWGDCEHPAKSAPGGCSLQSFVVQHPRQEELAEIFAAIDLPVAVQESQEPGLQIVIVTPNGEISL